MKPTDTIRISHPSAALVAFITDARRRKGDRIESMRQEFLKKQK